LSFYLLRGNALDSAANLAFPGGFEVVKAIDDTGRVIVNPTNPSYFTTAGWFSMELKTETGKKVDAFSKPFDVEMPINRNVVNPNTNLAVKVGDKIPIWSMNNKTGVWKKEGEAMVFDAGGGLLKTKYSIKHLSDWNLDFLQNGCNAGTAITVKYNIPPGGIDFNGSYFSQYIRESDGVTVSNTNLPILSLGSVPVGGNTLTLLRAAANSRLYVHEGNDINSPIGGINTALRGRTTLLNCGGQGTLGLIGSNNIFPCVDLEFKVRDGGIDKHLCNSAVWYKEGSCASGYLFHSGETAIGLVKVFSDANNTQCLELRFTTTETVPRAIRLTFSIPYSNPSTVFTPSTGDVYIGGSASSSGTFNFEYLASNSGLNPPNCGKKVQIIITNGVSGVPTCPGE
jgi:hypothetical protein